MRVPVDDEYRPWLTVPFRRTVLVVVRTATTLNRLADIVALIETDRRVQVVHTHDPASPAVFAAGLDELLAAHGARVIPWEQAVATRFDLALAASENDRLHRLNAPVLLVPHGLGYQKRYPRSTVVAGMDPALLARRGPDGSPVPTVLALSHSDQRTELAAADPGAVDRAVVIGDPTLDRMTASAHRAPYYRDALGAADTRLVVLASTWGGHSLFGSLPDLPERLLAALPADEYTVAVVLHPGVWAAHGRRPVAGWLSVAAEFGARIVPPHDGWAATLLAASCVVSDGGSLSLYAAARDAPVLLAGAPATSAVPRSPLADLVAAAPRLDPAGDLRAQIDAAVEGHEPGRYAAVVDRAVERPGGSAAALRALLYRLLGCAEPPGAAEFPPLSTPDVRRAPAPTHVAGAAVTGGTVAVTRYPALPGAGPRPGLDHRHVVADAARSSLRHLDAADVVTVPVDGPARFAERAHDELARRPRTRLVAAALDAGTCLVATRDGAPVTVSAEQPVPDPLVLASVAYALLAEHRPLAGRVMVRLGNREIHTTWR